MAALCLSMPPVQHTLIIDSVEPAAATWMCDVWRQQPHRVAYPLPHWLHSAGAHQPGTAQIPRSVMAAACASPYLEHLLCQLLRCSQLDVAAWRDDDRSTALQVVLRHTGGEAALPGAVGRKVQALLYAGVPLRGSGGGGVLERLQAAGASLRLFTRGDTAVVRRRFGPQEYFEAVGSLEAPPIRFSREGWPLSTRVVGTYVRPSLLGGWRSADALQRAAKVVGTLGTFVVALLSLVDIASDLVVAAELLAGGHAGWGGACIAITVLGVLVERRCGLYRAMLRLLVERETGITIDVATATGQTLAVVGPAPQVMVRAAPQVVLQLLVGLQLGYITPTRAWSLLLSVASLGVALAAGDRAAVVAHAAQREQRCVAFPLGLDLVQEGGGGRAWVCGRVMATPDFAVVAAFRLVEVCARLGAAALFLRAAAGWAVVVMGVVWVLAGSAVWWFSSLPLLLSLPRNVREVALVLRPAPPRVTLGRVAGALAYTAVAFPGVAPWVGGLWTRGWTLSAAAFCGMRVVEYGMVAAVV